MVNKLTEKLAETLFTMLMLQYKNKGVFPTQVAVAEAMGLNPETARNKYNALKKKGLFFRNKEGLYQFDDYLCTSSATAKLLLTIYDQKEHMIEKSKLIAILKKDKEFQNYDFDKVLPALEKGGYIKRYMSRTYKILPNAKLDYHELYLRKLSKENI